MTQDVQKLGEAVAGLVRARRTGQDALEASTSTTRTPADAIADCRQWRRERARREYHRAYTRGYRAGKRDGAKIAGRALGDPAAGAVSNGGTGRLSVS